MAVRALVACEYSGAVRDALIAKGIDAMSCDLLDTETPGPHYKGDVRDVINGDWDLIIAHPVCTFLSNSGVRWLHSDIKRWPELFKAASFFNLFKGKAKFVAIENPVMHKYGRALCGDCSMTTQPYEHGDPYTKRTCFWLENLPPLKPSQFIEGPYEAEVHKMPPSKDRAKKRSKTYPGIAKAIADQWGGYAILQAEADNAA